MADAAKAAGLAARDDPTAVAREARWQLRHASPTVREVRVRAENLVMSRVFAAVLMG